MKCNLKAAVIGSGLMGKKHANVLKDIVESLIICSNDELGGKTLAEEVGGKYYSDYTEMLIKEDLDFVSICLPTHLHHFAATEAIKRNINVLCEKPFASSFQEASDMVNRAKDANVLLMVAHSVRFNPYYEYLRNVYNDKRFGELVSVELYRHSHMPDWSMGNWLLDTSKSGGVICDFHVHETDITTSIFGVPDKVFAQLNGNSCCSAFIYSDGKIVNTSASWRSVRKCFEAGYNALFENAVVKYSAGVGISLHINDEVKVLNEDEIPSYLFGKDGYESEIRYFIQCLTEKKQPLKCMPEESATVMFINQAEVKSAELKEIVSIKL